MKIEVTKIEKVNLPNYKETISSGGESYTREAPLLAKYRVDICHGERSDKLFFEIRAQPHSGPLIDEYYEDQVYEAIHKILECLQDEQEISIAYNNISSQLSQLVFETWEGEEFEFPMVCEINT